MIKEKNSFQVALDSLKKGAVIFRPSGYKKYARCKTNFNGKEITSFGWISHDGKFNNGIYMDFEEILAEDWIVEWPEGTTPCN